MSHTSWFSRFANITSRAAGNARTFALAIFIIWIWALTEPFFDF